MSALPPARYTFGGDEHVFVEVAEEMSLPAFFKGMAITGIATRAVPGDTEICPANASYLVRFDPEVIAPEADDGTAAATSKSASDTAGRELRTRIVEIPVLLQRSVDPRDPDAIS